MFHIEEFFFWINFYEAVMFILVNIVNDGCVPWFTWRIFISWKKVDSSEWMTVLVAWEAFL